MATESLLLQLTVTSVGGTTVLSSEVSRLDTAHAIMERLHTEAGAPPPRLQTLMKDTDRLPLDISLGDVADPEDDKLSLQVIYTFVRLEKVGIRSGDLIDQLSFHYSDGTSALRGFNGGGERKPFVLEAGEFLQEIRYRKGDSLDAIQLVSSTGRESRWYGNTSGGEGPFSFKAASGMQIWSVMRSGGWRGCGGISQLIERPIDPKDWSATDWLEEAS